MYDELFDCVSVQLALLNTACLYIFEHPDIADRSVEGTNFAFRWSFWNWRVYIPRPVRDRRICRTKTCWQRVLGFTSLRNMLLTDRIDPADYVWLTNDHALALKNLLLHVDGPHESFDALIHELQC